jgi:UDP-GlcNAc:undecaprenyl-phosphate GlcNAc-1-phosphate transferase
MAAFLVDVSHKRRLFEVLLDVCLIGLAYYAAHLLFYGPLEPAGALRLFIESLPILAVIKLITFQAFGVYRGLWRYVSMHDLVVYAKAVAAASILSVLAFVFLMRFQGMSRVVFVLDGLFLFLLVCGSRAGFVLLRRMLPVKSHVQRKRVLIYGAGDGGELLLREVRNNPDLGCEPIGFADDDPRKKGKVIHGLRVFGGNGSLRLICQEQQIQAVYISSRKFTPERVEEIRTECGLDGVDLFRVRLSIEPVNGHANGKQMADELTPVIDNR